MFFDNFECTIIWLLLRMRYTLCISPVGSGLFLYGGNWAKPIQGFFVSQMNIFSCLEIFALKNSFIF